MDVFNSSFCVLELHLDKRERRDAVCGRPAVHADEEQRGEQRQCACSGEELEPAGLFTEETDAEGGEGIASQP